MVWTRIGRGGLEFLLTLCALLWLASLGSGLGGADWLKNSDGRYLRDLELKLEANPGQGAHVEGRG